MINFRWGQAGGQAGVQAASQASGFNLVGTRAISRGLRKDKGLGEARRKEGRSGV